MSDGFLVSPRSADNIRASAHMLLDKLVIAAPMVPILHIIETVLPCLDDEFSFEVMEPKDLASKYGYEAEGITDHRRNVIILRSDVYEGAASGNGRDRFTAAHELGHYLMHREEGLAFMRAVQPDTKAYRNSEWQANTYARELLVDLRKVDPGNSIFDVAAIFGVSYTVADIQLQQAKKLALGKGLI